MNGYMGLARETFDVSFAEQKFQEGKKALIKITSKVEGFDKLVTNEELSNKALKFFKKKHFSKIIIFQTTFTDAKFILSFATKIKKPICIVAFPEKRTGGRLRLNSICGLNLGMHSLIKNKIYSDFIIVENSENLKKKLSNFILKDKFTNKLTKWKKINKKNNNIKINIKKQNLGLIGKRPDGFDTCDYSANEIKKKLNFNIKKIELGDLFNQSRKTNKKLIETTRNKIDRDLKNTKNLNQKELDKSISIYHGLDTLKVKHDVQAFAIRCWPEMFTEYGCASCGPMAMMNENKVSSACEADVLGGISCNILNQLNNEPSLLVDIVDINEKDDSVVFWHCGLAPISMSIKGKAKADIHSNRKKPLLHNFSFKPGVITIFRVSKSANKLKFFVLKGKIINRKNSFSGTSGVVSFGKDTKGKIEKMLKGGLEHHVAFTYGNYYNEIIKLGNQMKIPTYTV